MIRRVLHLTLALTALAAVLTSTALAGGGKPKKHHSGSGTCVSAVCVYHESGLTSHKGPPLSGKAAAQVQKYGGKEARTLQELGSTRAFGAPRLAGQAASVGRVGTPSALLAIFDLGAGPIGLFVTLLAGAAAFALGRALRRRHNSA